MRMRAHSDVRSHDQEVHVYIYRNKTNLDLVFDNHYDLTRITIITRNTTLKQGNERERDRRERESKRAKRVGLGKFIRMLVLFKPENRHFDFSFSQRADIIKHAYQFALFSHYTHTHTHSRSLSLFSLSLSHTNTQQCPCPCLPLPQQQQPLLCQYRVHNCSTIMFTVRTYSKFFCCFVNI